MRRTVRVITPEIIALSQCQAWQEHRKDQTGLTYLAKPLLLLCRIGGRGI
jgi:hypothetical protein